MRPSQKSFLFFLADYHNVHHASAWPSLQTLAEDTGLSLRYIRRLVAQCVELGLISHEPGLGRGNKSRFRFVELDLAVIDAKGVQNGGRNKGQKEGQKEGLRDRTIRSEPEHEPDPRTKDQHARGALKVWLTVKEKLRREIPEEEWKLWVRPTYLFRVMSGSQLLLVMPPNNAIITAANNRKTMLRVRLAEHGLRLWLCSLSG